jgi:hypothetical protein
MGRGEVGVGLGEIPQAADLFDNCVNSLAMRVLAEHCAGRHVQIDAVHSGFDRTLNVVQVTSCVRQDLRPEPHICNGLTISGSLSE